MRKILNEEARKEIEQEVQHVPYKAAACIEALKIVQKYHRWVSDEALDELSQILEMSSDDIDSVATFYNMIFRKPVGRNTIHVCNSVTCWMLGYEGISHRLKEKLRLEYGQTTPDDRFTLLPIPCLGTCDHAPALIVNEDLYQDVTIDEIDRIIDKYK